MGVDNLRRCEEDLCDVVLALEPRAHRRLSGGALVRALGALGDFADLRMPERSGYARRVTRIASAAAATADLDAANARTVAHAALVDDLGAVAVPVGVWRGQPRPGSAGWEQVRLHPHWTARALGRCRGLEPVATVAGQHHERLDRSGYPAGLSGDLGRSAGLLACVVAFDETTVASAGAGRGHNPVDAASALARLAGDGALDRRDVAAVLETVGVAAPRVEVTRPPGLTEREVEVLGLLARGGTNRQIATALGISAKTVGAHIEHIYAKAGVRSRAAATLFAKQHDLVG